jgi:hypothetical protein
MVPETMEATTKGQGTKQEHHRCEDWCYLFFFFYQPLRKMSV